MTVHYALLDEIPGQARARLRLHGPDTRRFLQGTLSADVESLGPSNAVAAALCTVKGKLVTELVLLPGRDEEEVCVLLPAETSEDVARHFDDHIIMDDVEVEVQGRVGVAIAWADGEPPPAIGGLPSFVCRHPAPSRLCLGELDVLEAALAEHQKVDVNGWDAHRIATASPAWGHELEAGFFPPEVGFVYAVSYDKGCFLGQEPLARIHARGQVNRVMVQVRAAKAPTERVALAAEGREDAGRWTSWAIGDDGIEGLAIVRREVAVEGTRLTTVGEGSLEVVVASGPLGDDPGVGGRRRAATVKLGGKR
ncbi:MAG: hypothetical protein H6712_07090 [Myxococcales bacterium]|nr:hypothetical protein [Myxococcales bacterium]MCB9713599.1 hypothetical protein [Myxococcales bacterium]